jgi:hypothetical protein
MLARAAPQWCDVFHVAAKTFLLSVNFCPQAALQSRAKYCFLRAREGEAVRAIAAGRVVYADWMRGLGDRLIFDHSDGYLSFCRSNESLHKQRGDSVLAGEMRRPSGPPVAVRNRVYTLSSGIWAGHSILFPG